MSRVHYIRWHGIGASGLNLEQIFINMDYSLGYLLGSAYSDIEEIKNTHKQYCLSLSLSFLKCRDFLNQIQVYEVSYFDRVISPSTLNQR